jgi:hypothetical protein
MVRVRSSLEAGARRRSCACAEAVGGAAGEVGVDMGSPLSFVVFTDTGVEGGVGVTQIGGFLRLVTGVAGARP